MKPCPAFSRPTCSTPLHSKAAKKPFGSIISLAACRRPSSRPGKRLSWNPRRVFLMRSSQWHTRRWGNVPKRSVLQRTQFALRIGRRRSEEHTSELQSRQYLVCRLLLEKKKKIQTKDD